MRFLALDLSLTCIGYAGKAGDSITWGTYEPKGRGVARLADACTWLDGAAEEAGPDLVLIEGYSFGSRVTQAHSIGELGGVVRLFLYDAGIPFLDIPPACRAKLATGKGNAKKELVLVEAVKRLGYPGASFDAADARWILEAALQAYVDPHRATLPESHLEALKKIEWPRIEARETPL